MTTLYKYFLWIILLLSCSVLRAQSQQDSIKQTINSVFTAIKNSDTSLLKTCFTDSAILQTILAKKTGEVVIKTQTVKDFLHQMSTIPKDSCDEQIEYKSVNIDGAMANVFTPYSFYYNKKFSHCGANNFVLVYINNKWMIHYLIDTRRKKIVNNLKTPVK